MEKKIKYTEVSYVEFIKKLHFVYHTENKKIKRTEVEVAVCIGKSHMTVRNCFNFDTQVVSDKILTSLMACIKVQGKIEWNFGKKFYYLGK